VPAPEERIVDEKGVAWLSAEAAITLLARSGLSCSTATLRVWHRQGVPYQDGAKVRTREILTRADGHGGFKLRCYFSEEDTRTIPAAKAASQPKGEGQWPGTAEAKAQFGFGRWLLADLCRQKKLRWKTTPRVLPGGLTRQVRVFDPDDLRRCYEERAGCPLPGQDKGWLTFAEAAELLGCTRRMLHLWSTEGCPYLPGKRTLATMRRRVVYGRRTMTARLCSHDDVDVIRRGATSDHAHQGADGIYIPARVAKNKHHVSYEILRWWRARGWVRATRIPRPGRKHRWGLLWVFHEGDIIARKAGRSSGVPDQSASPPTRPSLDQRAAVPQPVAAIGQRLQREEVKPRWDPERRQLWFGERLLKSFDRQPATNQIHLIEAFDRAHWKQRVDNPFQCEVALGRRAPEQEKLKQTCKFLNAGLPPGTIRFGGDGSGCGVRWFLAGAVH
jgi:hypothetical protein